MRLGDLDDLKAKVALMFGDKTHITESVCELIDNAPTVEEVSIIELKEPLSLVKAQKIVKALSKRSQGEFTDLERKVIADSINYLLGAELLEENGYTEEVINALKSVLLKIGAEENHL